MSIAMEVIPFSEYIAKNHQRLVSTLSNKIFDRYLAEELIQNLWLKSARLDVLYNGTSSQFTFCITCALRRAIDVKRNDKTRRAILEEKKLYSDIYFDVYDTTAEIIERAGLTEEEHVLLSLYLKDGMSSEDIARHLHPEPRSTVYRRLDRMRMKIKTTIERESRGDE